VRGDRTGSDGQGLRQQRHPRQAGAKGLEPVIPPTANRLEIILYDKEQYKPRNKVERLFNKLKQCRRVATRYEKLTATFFGFVILALIVIMLR
jgi:transposase